MKAKNYEHYLREARALKTAREQRKKEKEDEMIAGIEYNIIQELSRDESRKNFKLCKMWLSGMDKLNIDWSSICERLCSKDVHVYEEKDQTIRVKIGG